MAQIYKMLCSLIENNRKISKNLVNKNNNIINNVNEKNNELTKNAIIPIIKNNEDIYVNK